MPKYKPIYETEEDTKSRYITPALLNAGWSKNNIAMEYSLTADRFRIVPGQNKTVREGKGGRSKPDYILFRGPNCPLAVIEAKRSGKDAREGIDQAVKYAKMLGVPFAYSTSGKDLVEIVIPEGKQRILPLDRFPSPEELWKHWCDLHHVTQPDRKKLEKALYYTTSDGKIPRYYQLLAINRTVDAVIAKHRKRVLLVMATGTGKTYTAFQIVWRLKKAGVVKNVLYLADRNQLIDQTMIDDFAPFNTKTKIQKGKINKSYEIYFGLYQQLAGDNIEGIGESSSNSLGISNSAYAVLENYKQVPPDYFDLVIVDECHRGSASEQSSWRVILDYFSSAVQIGMTATPNEKDGSNNLDYFGAPLITYSLKQGIEDGFLAPYQVISVKLDKDISGWEPEEGETDLNGEEIPKKKYTLSDFDKTLELQSRTKKVAERVTEYLHHIGRMSKTIIFCMTQRHALNMRDAIREYNQDLMAEDSDYAVRMTGDDEDGRALYDAFISVNNPYPVVVTTSKLLTTGANTKCVKLIVLDSNIQSMTEFKQIIGRGTRLRPDVGKTFFTILDFRGACTLFQDPDFDGKADSESTWTEDDPVPKIKTESGENGEEGKRAVAPDDKPDIPPVDPEDTKVHHRKVYIVGREVEISLLGESVQYLDENGKLVTENFKDYTRRNILSLFENEASFVKVWNGPETKRAILDDLEKQGILVAELKKELGNPDLDEFDMIRHIAFGEPLLTRQLRANKVKKTRFLEKYQGVAREILQHLLDLYSRIGITEIDAPAVLKDPVFAPYGGIPNIINNVFGGKRNYLTALKEMEKILYNEAV